MQVLGIGLMEVLTVLLVSVAYLPPRQLDRLINLAINAARNRWS